MRIGYLEDELPQAELVKSWLVEAEHEVIYAGTGREFIDALKNNPVDLLILDWQLPDMDGTQVMKTVREQLEMDVPIIFGTQRESEADIVSALQSGADDYLIKPLRKAELLARIGSLARRAGMISDDAVITVGHIELDTQNQQITVDGQDIKLTPKDYKVATCLLKNVGKMLSRDYLLREVWGIDVPLNTRTVDVHVSRVRRSLQLIPERGYCVKTVYQHGYRLESLNKDSFDDKQEKGALV